MMKSIIQSGIALGELAKKLHEDHSNFIDKVKRCAQEEINKTIHTPTLKEIAIKSEMKTICEKLLEELKS